MTGSGTAENPYIIMNADDLYSMSTTGNNETYFSLGADIDFNDTDYAENFTPISLNCKKFDGNGHVYEMSITVLWKLLQVCLQSREQKQKSP